MILKGIITEEDWETISNDIQFEFERDNHFTELKEAELLRERLQSLDMVQNYVGEYFSKEWVMKNVLMLNDDDIKTMKDQLSKEEPEEEEEPVPEPEEQPQTKGQDHNINIKVAK